MEESNITNFKKDNFSIYCNYNPDKKTTIISKKYIDIDTTHNLNLYIEDNDYTFEYEKKTDKFPYLNTSYYISRYNSSNIIMFEYPGIIKNKDKYEICLITGDIDEVSNSLQFKIKENSNTHVITKTKRNNIISITYESLNEKFGVFIHNHLKPDSEEKVSQIILDINDKKIVYEQDNENEAIYKLLGTKEEGYNTEPLYRNLGNEIIDKEGNIVLTGNYSLFNIFINPYIDKINNYINLILDNFPNIDKNIFKYDSRLLNRGYNDYLFPNIDKDIPVKDILKKIKTKNGSI